MTKSKALVENIALVDKNKSVIKANKLIQKSRFSLSTQQQKIMLYLIAQISPFDDDFKLYDFNILDFCKICGIETKGGKNYQDLKTAIKEIADKSLWVKLDNGQETLLRWIEKPYIDERNGTISIKLDKDMKPYLLQLKANFTQYELLWTLNFKSKYTIRLYELSKSIHYNVTKPYTKDYTLDELRKLLGAEKYIKYAAFKERVLEPAIKEINETSDIILEYEVIKRSRAVHRILLTVKLKGDIERLHAFQKIEDQYGLNQLTLWAKPQEDYGDRIVREHQRAQNGKE